VELEPVLREAVDRGAVGVVESVVHERESLPRPDLGLPALLRSLSGGRRVEGFDREIRRRLAATIAYELPERRPRQSDAADLDAVALALTHCELITCDAFMADVIRRAHLHHGRELFSGRRADVLALRDRLLASR
jgi:hypothetical protein